MPALQVLLLQLRIRLLAAVVGTSLVNLKKQNGPISVLVFTERAASKELMIMCNCDSSVFRQGSFNAAWKLRPQA